MKCPQTPPHAGKPVHTSPFDDSRSLLLRLRLLTLALVASPRCADSYGLAARLPLATNHDPQNAGLAGHICRLGGLAQPCPQLETRVPCSLAELSPCGGDFLRLL